ncbi:MAG: NAD(P)-dependent oxidoreductase [Ruminococcus sp.]|nr:NAD(P)-dependent oxidoreductase [Ruminococcus sp.]
MIEQNQILLEDFKEIAKSLKNPELFRGKKFLITGATGLVGSLLIRTLLFLNEVLELELKIYAVVRDSEKAATIFANVGSKQSLSFIVQDLSEEVIRFDLEHIDYIIHTAAVTESKRMVTNPVETLSMAYHSTEAILKLAREQQVSGVVYISSMEVYGQMHTEHKTTESDLGYVDLTSVRTCYPEGKRVCECLCNAYAKEYSVPVKIARLAQTFGAGVSEKENRVFAQFAKSTVRGEDIVLHTKGESEGNYVYTADAVAAILLLLTEGVPGESYNVSNEESHMKIREMAEMVLAEFSEGRGRIIFDIPEDSLKYGFAPTVHMYLSNEKLRSLGWKPCVNLPEQYRRMIRFWQSETAGG